MIPAIHSWQTNGHLIKDVATLHLSGVETVFDATYGKGTWWTEWKPPKLVTNDLHVKAMHADDFEDLPWADREWECVAYDPPYKLTGTPMVPELDERFGITKMNWQDRWEMIMAGFRECIRVTDRILLAKCQDQVCSGKMRWMSFEMTVEAVLEDFELVDRFDYTGRGIPQPKNRRQVHARGRGSTLLVFRRLGPYQKTA